MGIKMKTKKTNKQSIFKKMSIKEANAKSLLKRL